MKAKEPTLFELNEIILTLKNKIFNENQIYKKEQLERKLEAATIQYERILGYNKNG